MKWIPCSKRLPKKSGVYFTAHKIESPYIPEDEPTYITTATWYSKQYEKWNAFDGANPPEHAFDNVDYWAHIPKIAPNATMV